MCKKSKFEIICYIINDKRMCCELAGCKYFSNVGKINCTKNWQKALILCILNFFIEKWVLIINTMFYTHGGGKFLKKLVLCGVFGAFNKLLASFGYNSHIFSPSDLM